MKVAIIYNKDFTRVINQFGMQNKEKYNPNTVKRVADALEGGGHNVEIIDGNMQVIDALQHFMPKVIEGERMGMVFNMAYGIQGESRYTHVPSMLEMLGIPYIGSTPAGHAIALDKIITKIIMQKSGIPTPQFHVFSRAEEDMSGVEYPVIVKPKMEAVSFGLKVVHEEPELREAVRFIIGEFEQQALVEQFIPGREFAVGLIGNNPVEAFPVLEIDLEGDPNAIQTVYDKREKPREKICPAVLDEEAAAEMKRLSIAAFLALGLRDFARVDIRLDDNNNIYLLEINSMASLGATGSYSFAAQAAGYDYKALVNKMLDVAAVRYFADTSIADEQRGKKLPLHIRVRGFLRSRKPALEELLHKMVNLNTYVRNLEGVNALGTLVKKELSSLGFSHQSYPQVEVGNISFFSNTESDKLDILFIGTLDNNTRSAKQEYFRAEGQRIIGTGVWEHKGGLAVLIAALLALKFVKQIRNMNIGILLTSDDTLQGRISKNLIEQHGASARYVVGLHGSSTMGSVVTSRSGSAVYNVYLKLKETDSSANVASASQIFSKMINDIVNLNDQSSGLAIAPTKMNFESNISTLYAHGEAAISVRFDNADQMKSVDDAIKKIVMNRKRKKMVDVLLDGSMRRPAMTRDEKTEKIFALMKGIADRLDIRLTEEHRWSSAGIAFVPGRTSKIDGAGPVGSKTHDNSEFILRHSLLERSTLLAMTMIELRNRQDA